MLCALRIARLINLKYDEEKMKEMITVMMNIIAGGGGRGGSKERDAVKYISFHVQMSK